LSVLAGRIDVLLFGHEHHHLNFSGTDLSKDYRIPWILSCGKTTENSKEYAVNNKGETTDKILNTGMLANQIDIDNKGKVTTKTITF
jgi:hypothetical protein